MSHEAPLMDVVFAVVVVVALADGFHYSGRPRDSNTKGATFDHLPDRAWSAGRIIMMAKIIVFISLDFISLARSLDVVVVFPLSLSLTHKQSSDSCSLMAQLGTLSCARNTRKVATRALFFRETLASRRPPRADNDRHSEEHARARNCAMLSSSGALAGCLDASRLLLHLVCRRRRRRLVWIRSRHNSLYQENWTQQKAPHSLSSRWPTRRRLTCTGGWASKFAGGAPGGQIPLLSCRKVTIVDNLGRLVCTATIAMCSLADILIRWMSDKRRDHAL